MNITQLAPKSDVKAIDASKITIVGAALNAGFGEDVQLTVATPEKEVTVPEGIKAEKLVILHYHGDAKEPVIITPVVSEDGKMMTFTVTGFSTFVVTNVAESPKTADDSVAVVCAMMLVAAAAVVVFRKKAVK